MTEPQDVALVRNYAKTEAVHHISRSGAPKDAAPIAVSVVRNERARLPEFLDHHRRLGVRRFAVIDNASEDGTAAYLAHQPDVDLFSAPGKFEWRRKHGWITNVIARLGQTRWYLLLDADEHVVFADCERRPVQDLIAGLSQKGARRARACLVDMYAKGPIVAPSPDPDAPLAARYPYFDASTYHEHRNATLTARTGGPRARLTAGATQGETGPALTKYPLFRLSKHETAYNPHAIWPPIETAEDPCLIALKHYKFDEDLAEKIRYALASKAYWNDSAEYALYHNALQRDPEFSLFFEGSRRFESAEDFLAHGLISAMEPDRRENPLALQIKLARRRRLAERLA